VHGCDPEIPKDSMCCEERFRRTLEQWSLILNVLAVLPKQSSLLDEAGAGLNTRSKVDASQAAQQRIRVHHVSVV
jgi:hypothetical protein